MGWLCSDETPKKVKEQYIKEFSNNQNPHYTFIDIKTTHYGRHIWIALKDNDTNESIILLVLLEKHGQEWARKSMTESELPYYFDCPLSLLDKTTGTNKKESIEWRAKVKNYWYLKNKKWDSGDVVKVYDKLYKILRPHKKGYIIQDIISGACYKGQPHTFEEINNSVNFVLGDQTNV